MFWKGPTLGIRAGFGQGRTNLGVFSRLRRAGGTGMPEGVGSSGKEEADGTGAPKAKRQTLIIMQAVGSAAC